MPSAPHNRVTPSSTRKHVTMASITIEETPPQRAAPRALATGFTALRIFFGLDWLSNGLAKLFDAGNYDWGFFSFNLITRGAARSIATDAASKTQIAPLGAFYRDVVLPHWDFSGLCRTSLNSPSGSASCSGSQPASRQSVGCS